MDAGRRKLFLGGRLKRLRRDLGLTQSQMAEDLGVSPSYLNHLERNQRPVTAQILLRLAETYDLDLRAFSATGDRAPRPTWRRCFADPMFRTWPCRATRSPSWPRTRPARPRPWCASTAPSPTAAGATETSGRLGRPG